jgi:hypothetical protein
MNANTKNKLIAALNVFRTIEDNDLMNLSESAVDAGMFEDYTYSYHHYCALRIGLVSLAQLAVDHPSQVDQSQIDFLLETADTWRDEED